MLTENADCKREATSKIFPVYRNIFGVSRATKYTRRMQESDAACCNASQAVKIKMYVLQHLLVLQST